MKGCDILEIIGAVIITALVIVILDLAVGAGIIIGHMIENEITFKNIIVKMAWIAVGMFLFTSILAIATLFIC